MCMAWTVFDSLERLSVVSQDAKSFTCCDRSWTFGETYERTVRLAQALTGLGLRKGDVIAIHSDNCHRYMETFFACARIGAVFTPISTRLSDPEIDVMIEDAKPSAVVVDRHNRSALWTLGRVPVVITYEPTRGPHHSYETLVDSAPYDDSNDTVEVDEDDGLAILYTAAVDGKPQGAILSHRNVMAQVTQTATAYDLHSRDVYGCFLPMYHTLGLYFPVVAATLGIESVVVPKFDAQHALEAVLKNKVTYFAEFAPMAKRVLEASLERRVNLEGKIRMIVGLDTPETIDDYLRLGTAWYGVYGQTEVSGIIATGEVTAPFTQLSFAGKEMTRSKVRIYNESQTPVGPGAVGEICVRGPVCSSGYYHKQNALRWTADGWLQTGDLGRIEADGTLYFMGRKQIKDLIKPGGENVYPVEVEQVLSAHPAVRRCCVIGVPDPLWLERIKAVVELRTDVMTPTADILITFCKQRIASYKCPSVVTFVDALPLHEGKFVARDEVRRLYGETTQDLASG